MSNKQGIIVGQTAYSLNVGNAARRSKQELTARTVTKVGRKYFYYVEHGTDVKINFESMDNSMEYSATSKVYLSPQEWEDSKEQAKVFEVLRKHMSTYSNHKNWSTAQMKEAMDVLGLEY